MTTILLYWWPQFYWQGDKEWSWQNIIAAATLRDNSSPAFPSDRRQYKTQFSHQTLDNRVIMLYQILKNDTLFPGGFASQSIDMLVQNAEIRVMRAASEVGNICISKEHDFKGYFDRFQGWIIGRETESSLSLTFTVKSETRNKDWSIDKLRRKLTDAMQEAFL